MPEISPSMEHPKAAAVGKKASELRFILCGSQGDGKSTLIGRLAHDNQTTNSTSAHTPDLLQLSAALDVDTEQGLTTDIEYRHFDTPNRRYIVAEISEQEQYARTMTTAISGAHVAIILVDASKGIDAQTHSYSRMVALMGVKRIILAVNKVDAVDYDSAVFQRIVSEYEQFAQSLGCDEIIFVPISGLAGDNIAQASHQTPWYKGLSLMSHLDAVELIDTPSENAFRLTVRQGSTQKLDDFGHSGSLLGGSVSCGQDVRVLPSGQQSSIKKIISGNEEVETANCDDAVTLVLEDDIEVSRGDVIVASDSPPEVADQFEAMVLWLSDKELKPGRQYLIQLGSNEVTATVTEIKYAVDVKTGVHLAAKTLKLNDVAVANFSTNSPLVFEPYGTNRQLGSFRFVDKQTDETVAAGIIDFALRRASNIHWQALELNKATRAAQKKQTPCCVWLTGLSGSGKSTIANLLEKRLHSEGKHTYLLDGDNVRHGLNRDLGFTEADRVENIRRVGEVSKLMIDAGLIVLVSFISPFKAERAMARDLFEDNEFIEVFIDTPLAECERRDVKGLYAKARAGELKNFTGIDSPYEAPENPEIHVHTDELSLDECVEKILLALQP